MEGSGRRCRRRKEVNMVSDSLTDQGSGSQEATGDQVVQRDLIIQRDMVRVLAVCLMLLCVLPVVRTTDMAMDYNSDNNHTNCYNLTLDRDQLYTKYNNLTLERDQLQIKYNHLTVERDQLYTERDQLYTKYNNLTLQKDQLYTKYNHLILERDQLEAHLILQWDQLYTKYNNLIRKRDLLQREVNQLTRERADKSCPSGWQKFGCSCYYTSTEFKTWEESREECVKTGADLLIINSKEEQEFIAGLNPGDRFASSWIGVKMTEGKWTWVDGTPLTTRYWASDFPHKDEDRNCASYSHSYGGWSNWLCSYEAYWICEKILCDVMRECGLTNTNSEFLKHRPERPPHPPV